MPERRPLPQVIVQGMDGAWVCYRVLSPVIVLGVPYEKLLAADGAVSTIEAKTFADMRESGKVQDAPEPPPDFR